MALKLRVSFADKEEAKRKGALWSVADKTWFVPPHRDYNQFTQWWEAGEATLILQAPYYVATSTIYCWKCTQSTTVAALAADSYCLLDYDDSESDEVTEDAPKSWYRQQEFVFISGVGYVDEATTAQLAAAYPFFRLGHSRAGGSYWANHCQHCQALQGDFFLHQEPGGAFSPTTVAECQRLTLEVQPTPYDCILNAGVNWSSFDAQVPRYAKRRRIAPTAE
ncbi:DUF5710 domain-containing protein [Hymenobacter rigui]|uniref:DUF5710 domain-containing protein n=1 Tax=Hymenobacter rigui TaxID=334424 RepID=A0A3R9MPR3_9BACT|nr:DUF5710 domain-containing protein [Hymenobacter rigui]RSK45483.1 hypothetical protein EI291_17965 [Hymenobacter rigui]